MKWLLLMLSAFLVVALSVTTAFAQTDIAESRKAIVCLEIQVAQLLESEFGRSLGEDGLAEITREMDFLPVGKFKRVFGLVGAANTPEDYAPKPFFDEPVDEDAFDIPFGLVFEYQMVDAESAKLILEKLDFNLEESQEIDGVKYHSIDSRFAPQNLIGGIKDETTVIFGTKDFVLADHYDDLFSDELAARWARQPAAPARLSIEMMSKATLISEMVELSKQDAPPVISPILDLVAKVGAVDLSIDPAANEMIKLRGVGKSDAEGEELRGGLDGLLGFAKLSTGALTAEMSEVPKTAAIVRAMMDDLRTSGDGPNVNITINRPDGFNEALAELRVWMVTFGKEMARSNNMRQLILAVHNFESTHTEFPFSDDAAKPSWRKELLPFLDVNEVPKQMPSFFGDEGDRSTVVHIRPERVPTKIREFTDGLSNTICFIEYPAGVVWTENQDITPEQVVEMLENLKEGEIRVAALYDGSVIKIRHGVSIELIKKMLTPSGGEPITPEESRSLR